MAYRSSSNNSGSGTNPSVGVPASVATDEIIILLCSIDAQAAAFDPADWPTGFTELDETDITHDGQTFAVAWKRTTGADSGTYSFGNVGSTNDWTVIALAFSGRHTTNPPVSSTVSVSNAANNTPLTVNANGVTAVTGDDLAWIAATDMNNGTSVPACAPPASYTERKDVGANWAYATAATRDNVSSGATGTVSGTYTWTSATSGYAAWLIRIPAAPAGDVSLALTGQSAASSAGTLPPATSKALSGQALTGSAGVFAPASSVALSGQVAASAAGTVAPGVSIALTGQAVSIALGTISAGGDVTLALTGQVVSLASGTLIPAASVALSGIALSSAGGLLLPANSKALTGSAIAGAQGTLVPALGTALSGNLLTIGQGNVTAPGNVTVALTGQVLAASQGVFSLSFSKSLSGSSTTTTAGTLTASPSKDLSGNAVAASTGSMSLAFSVSLSGSLASLTQGTVFSASGGSVAEVRVNFSAASEQKAFRARAEARQFVARRTIH